MSADRVARALPPLGLAALTLAFAFRAGGYYADAHGFAAAGLLAVLALRVALVERPFAGFGRGAAVVAGALAALLAWTLASAAWSGAAGRAVLEADRLLAYGLILVLFASAPRRPGALERLLSALTVAASAVCLAALATRLFPDVLETTPNIFPGRLGWPIGYWNALGLLAALAAAGLLHLGAAARTTVARAGAVAVLVAVLTTLLLTFSRGSLLVAVLAAAVYAVLARPPGLPAAIVAAAPGAAVAIVAALRADALAGEDPASAAAASQGHDLALVVLAAAVGSGAVRVLLRRWEVRRPGWVPRIRIDRRRAAALAGAAVLLLAGAGAATGAVDRALEAFGGSPSAAGGADARQRLLDPSGSSRRAYWDAALTAFTEAPAQGRGAGTYQLEWWRHRPLPADVVNAHSLPLETLAELGVVGLLLLGAALAGIGLALARPRVASRGARGLVLALLAAWGLHALIDWDWQLPVVTAWIFAVGGSALARPAGAPARGSAPPLAVRGLAAFALLAAAAAPALVALSELRTRSALTAFAAGDCATAAEDARLARRALPLRAEPDAVLGYCAARAGDPSAAVAALRRARERDPRDWEHAYGEAVVRAAAGEPAAAAADRAAALNPLQPDLAALRMSLATEDPRTQKRRAATARLFISGFDYPPVGGTTP